MKLKTKPSEKVHRRYLLLEGKGVSKDKVEKIILDYVGVLGWAKAKPLFVGNNKLAVETKSVTNVVASFELCKEDIKVKRVSGTLKGLGK